MATTGTTTPTAPRVPARHDRPGRKPLIIRRRASLREKRSPLLTALSAIVVIYSLVPLLWLVINATKSQEGLFHSFGLWFSGDFSLWSNVRATFTYNGGIFARWLLNTLLYVVVGAGG